MILEDAHVVLWLAIVLAAEIGIALIIVLFAISRLEELIRRIYTLTGDEPDEPDPSPLFPPDMDD